MIELGYIFFHGSTLRVASYARTRLLCYVLLPTLSSIPYISLESMISSSAVKDVIFQA